MTVRAMQLGDVQEVSRIVMAAFSDSVASGLSQEGVSTFMGLSAPEAFAKRMSEDNCMLVYEEQDGIVGMIELKEGRHVAMLFVAPGSQGRGIGRELVREALSRRRVQSVTVSASLTSVIAYEKYGFEVVGAEEETQGLRYIPMKIELKNSMNPDNLSHSEPSVAG
ncbi:MAG: GNAT family N-acetyltransferase [Pseudomonadota bacterium]